jgi:hypothetical protein
MPNFSFPYPLLRLLRYGKPYQVQIYSTVACWIFRTLFDLAKPKARANCKLQFQKERLPTNDSQYTHFFKPLVSRYQTC